jgi:hypothetical protein
VTPETEHTTHNFYAICREARPPFGDALPPANQVNTVAEDTRALELLERTLAGALIGGRMIADLVRAEGS